MTTLERPLTAAPVDAVVQRRTRPSGAAAAAAVSVVVYLWLCWQVRAFVTDDAWISVRYAENLAHGHGFVWNPGGERVEGYSNPLLVMIEALADVLGVPAMRAARVLGVLSGLACLVVVYVRGQYVIGRTGAAAAAMLIACSAPMAVWAVGGLETLPTALVLTVAVLELARNEGGRLKLAAAAMALLPWLRPEGLAAVALLAVLSEGAGCVRRATRRRAFRRLVLLAGVPALSQVLLEVFRLTVYGHLLPNSVLFKVGEGEPFQVAENFLRQGAIVLILGVLGMVIARGRQRLLVVPPVVYLMGSVGMLDNVNAFSRFFLPVWPQLALLAGLGVAALVTAADGHRRTVAVCALTTSCGLALLALPPGDLNSATSFAQGYRDCKTTARAGMASWLQTTPRETTFAIVDAGLVPARAGERTAIESLFLNEALLQRTGAMSTGQQVAEILRRQPDVLVVASARTDAFVGIYEVDRALLEDPRGRAYRQVFVAPGNGPGCDYHLMAYRR